MARHTDVDYHIKDLIVRSGLPLDILETASQGGGSQAPSRAASVSSISSSTKKQGPGSDSVMPDDVRASLKQNLVK